MENYLTKNGKAVLTTINELPLKVQELLREKQIKSLIAYPLYCDEVLVGFIGYEQIGQQREWTSADQYILATVSAIISTMYDKHRVLSKIEETKDNFEHFFNTVEDIIFVMDTEGNIKASNPAAISVSGYSAQELEGKNIVDLNIIDYWQQAFDLVNNQYQENNDFCTISLKNKQNKIIPVCTKFLSGKWNNQPCIFCISKNVSKEQEALQKFKKLFARNPALMAINSIEDQKFIDVNEAFAKRVGYSKEQCIGKTGKQLNIFSDLEHEEKMTKLFLEHGRITNEKVVIQCKDGSNLIGLLYGEIIQSNNQAFFLTVMLDITEQEKLSQLYNQERTRLTSIIDASNLGTWEWNIPLGTQVFNEHWAKMIGYTVADLQPTTVDTWINLIHPDDQQRVKDSLTEHFASDTELYDIEFRMHHRAGHWVWINSRGKVIEKDAQGEPIRMFGTHVDITERKKIENQIKELSIRDPLTNIYNRRYIYDRLTNDLDLSTKENNLCLAILDIDYFKRINDQYGHQAGDYILKQFTETIKTYLKPSALLGRYGGEEFIIILYDYTLIEAKKCIHKILQVINQKEFFYQQQKITFTFSAGIAANYEAITSGLKSEKMIALADDRLYQAKNQGRNTIVIND